jgi:molecular chaperone DnaK (HSP70)
VFLSANSIQQKGRVDIIANDQGHRITPSWVSFTDEERLIGDAAKNAFHTNPTNTVFDAKRESLSITQLSPLEMPIMISSLIVFVYRKPKQV